jgi:hypothetical protein
MESLQTHFASRFLGYTWIFLLLFWWLRRQGVQDRSARGEMDGLISFRKISKRSREENTSTAREVKFEDTAKEVLRSDQ